MKKLSVMLALAGACSWANAGEADQLLKKAMARDYQAQRNLAYSYQQGASGLPKDFMKACMWRTVIIQSGSAEVDDSDVSNHSYACGKLSDTAKVAAVRQGEELSKKLYK